MILWHVWGQASEEGRSLVLIRLGTDSSLSPALSIHRKMSNGGKEDEKEERRMAISEISLKKEGLLELVQWPFFFSDQKLYCG